MFGLTRKEEKVVIFWIKGEGQSTCGLVSVFMAYKYNKENK